jgi:hypothetical protein
MFFVFGPLWFVILMTILNFSLRSNGKSLTSLLDSVALMGWVVLIMCLLFWGSYYSYTKIATPSYSVEGYINNWNWVKKDNRYIVDNYQINLDISPEEVKYLPPPDDMKKILNNTMNLAKTNKNHKGCRLGQLYVYFTNKNTITTRIGYHCKGTWVEDPILYVYDLKTLSLIK